MGDGLETVHIALRDGASLPALLGQPVGGGAAAGVLVVHGMPGLDALARELVARLAGAGHVALAPDRGADPAPATDRGSLAVLEAGLDHLIEESGADAERLAVVGVGFGGVQALLLACTGDRLRAVVDLEGDPLLPELSRERPVQPLDLLLNLSAPLLAQFGERDPATGSGSVERLRATLVQFALPGEVLIHPEAGAGFLDAQGDGYHGPVASRAWERTMGFLREELGAAP